jgi:RHS repeat-associated protein
MCEERDATSGTTRIYEHGEASSGDSTFTVTDHLGSTRAIANSVGAVLGLYNYDPFGRIETSSATKPRFGFSGHTVVGTGEMLLAQYRVYAPDLGRWLSEDPIGFAGSSNFYAYVENSPVARVDPLGLQSVSCRFCGSSQTAAATTAVQSVCANFKKPGNCKNIITAYGHQGCWTERCDAGVAVTCMTMNCSSDSCGGSCNMGSDYKSYVYLQPNAFKPGGCFGSLENTVAHEMAHMCGVNPDNTGGPNDRTNRDMANFIAKLCAK